ncbi:hypothetical protein RHECIAT_CH0000802 [Rhizobium etli CIAT 652]|uniref:Uncharacterized protein n=1 Tax=Rhizobium etli (strain CIAT 652) TaxID=491916 RepID=B3PQE5_RHIE6|nr:hypothetical protein RHECIAT_CH0000802 [Rhizobium etli CIAT 652]KKZ87843.1 hypothetical protein RPHASCH2410_CH10650 [Rhizobium phaseoli Ch24-10]
MAPKVVCCPAFNPPPQCRLYIMLHCIIKAGTRSDPTPGEQAGKRRSQRRFKIAESARRWRDLHLADISYIRRNQRLTA